MNSNYTLKFPRSYREATGSDCQFEHKNPDRMVFMACLVCAAFLLGLMIGGAI